MRIFFIGQKGIPSSYGGVENHVEQLAVRLAAKGHKVHAYCRRWYQQITFPINPNQNQYKKVNLLTFPSINNKNIDTILSTSLNTLNVLTKKADIIHYHGIGPSSLLFIPRFLKRKSRIVGTFHCRDYHHQKWGFFAQEYLKFGEKICVHFSHNAIAVSQALQDYARKKYHKEIAYIPNGVPIMKKERPKLISDWNLERNKYIITVARLVRHKNIHHLIKAYQRIYQKPTPTHPKLVIVGGPADGGGKYEESLKKISKENPNIVFTGYQTGHLLAELFSNAYFYVHPSISEGLPIAILEAMAYGKCPLVSNIPENLEPISDFGFSFKVGSIKDLTEKLRALLHKPKLVQETGEKARKHVRKNYNWDQIIEKTQEFYDGLYHHHPSHIHPKDFAIHHWDRVAELTEKFYLNLF